MTSVGRACQVLVVTAAVAFGLAAGPAGQAGQPARTQMDELLAEVRALRADLDRAAAASMRGQLLGMRLQLQEQRITAIARQLSDVQQRLRENAQARGALQGSMKMLAGMKDDDSPGNAEAMKFFAGPFKQQLAGLDASDAELKAEETQLMGQLHDEQNRWSTFNGQIEEMERAAAGKQIR